MSEPIEGNQKSNLWQKFSPSLLEVVAILIVVVIFAQVLRPKSSQAERVKKVAAHGQIQSFKAPLEIFEVENGHYPTNLNDLVIKPPDASTNWEQHLDKVPLDPWGHPYLYQFPGKHGPQPYDLSSAGPDGKFGTKDDIKNWE